MAYEDDDYYYGNAGYEDQYDPDMDMDWDQPSEPKEEERDLGGFLGSGFKYVPGDPFW